LKTFFKSFGNEKMRKKRKLSSKTKYSPVTEISTTWRVTKTLNFTKIQSMTIFLKGLLDFRMKSSVQNFWSRHLKLNGSSLKFAKSFLIMRM